MFELKVHIENHDRFYKVTTANRTVIGERLIEFIQDKWINFYLSEILPSGDLKWVYKLQAHTMKGTVPLHYLSDDLEELQSDIIFITDNTGNLRDILNFKSIGEKFDMYFINKLRKKHPHNLDEIIHETSNLLQNKDRFIASFKGYSSWRMFFQNRFRRYENGEIYTICFDRYFGHIDLPLIIESKIEETRPDNNQHHIIKNSAELDKEKFKRKEFARMLKDLTGIYNIDATLTVDMEEIYDYNKDGDINEVNLFLNTTVTNWYSVTNAHYLRCMSPDEYEKDMILIQQRKNSNIIVD